MTNIISLSVTDRNKAYCKANNVSPSKIYSEAMALHRRMIEFSNIYSIIDFYDIYNEVIRKIQILQKEIVRRNETIEALQDVLAQKEINERRT